MTPVRSRPLSVRGAFVFVPEVYPDHRGQFVSVFQSPVFASVVGGALFEVAQASVSVSAVDVVRGVHYTATPPGCAKYVYCPSGRVLDVVVDLRVGSPTFGVWDSVELSGAGEAVYLPVGVGHAFVSLVDSSAVAYLLSRNYDPAVELAVSVRGLGLPLPASPILSDRDRAAPSLEDALSRGLLPLYSACL
ncbi:dTDP-4-dehydrorhamnose 3,5-epimerase [Actinocrispum sp. NPDC049592]|uniref:dTDP-4-dehydrorhamnose 3,5-epimerase family protein n=1 Tax=Actinocrispum sp. NPDC049592 TaxID=3154835 RepID=UPI003449447D